MNNDQLIFSNKMADIYYDPEIKMMVAIYHGLVEYELFSNIIEAVNNIAITKGLNGAVSDVTKLRGSYQKVLGYMENTGFPLLIENGYRAHAQIISDDLIMINLSDKVEKIITSMGVKFKIFKDREEGKEWLAEALLKGK